MIVVFMETPFFVVGAYFLRGHTCGNNACALFKQFSGRRKTRFRATDHRAPHFARRKKADHYENAPAKRGACRDDCAHCRRLFTASEQHAVWRATRFGLNARAKFGVFESDSNNFGFVTTTFDPATNKVDLKDTVSLSEFYDVCWDPLLAAYQNAAPGDDPSWISFRQKLDGDGFMQKWPKTNPVMSSVFIKLRKFPAQARLRLPASVLSRLSSSTWRFGLSGYIGEVARSIVSNTTLAGLVRPIRLHT
ncbi:MAG: hypothetical protein GEU91_21200 [Rhizobiales bacterium]|nr:hypothetical protein [Hyphomicrobiales bacterium]